MDVVFKNQLRRPVRFRVVPPDGFETLKPQRTGQLRGLFQTFFQRQPLFEKGIAEKPSPVRIPAEGFEGLTVVD